MSDDARRFDLDGNLVAGTADPAPEGPSVSAQDVAAVPADPAYPAGTSGAPDPVLKAPREAVTAVPERTPMQQALDGFTHDPEDTRTPAEQFLTAGPIPTQETHTDA